MMPRTSPLAVSALVGLLAFGSASRALADAPPDEALRRAEAALLRGDYGAAERSLVAVKSGPGRSDALLALARVELETGRYAAASATAKAASTLGSDAKVRAAPLRAMALARLGKIAEAIAAAEEVALEDRAFRANLVLGELLIRSGRRNDARAPLMRVIQAYNDDRITDADAEGLTLVGRAAHLLRNAKEANNAYNLAEKVGGKARVETLLFRAELFLDKYDPGHAAEVIKDALKLSPKSPAAHVLMARVKLESAMDFEGAESEIAQALAVDPNLAEAFVVRAGLALRDMDIAGAVAAADAGLKTNPTDLELLSMKAAAAFLADDKRGFEALKARVFALNAEFSAFYSIVGEYAEWEHRYDDIVAMMREAIGVDPRDAKAHAALGLNLIRAGDEAAGLGALKRAWDLDHFNVRVFNTLNLYEKTIAADYVTVDGKPFKLRYHRDEKAMLERYVPRMLEEAWASMVERYRFTPKNPVFIELYADAEHFSVRTSGLPNVGIQGVCFGETLAAMSPSAGSFNWGNVLWHELAHVFAIQLSKNHVPRWFTEGLSEYETIIRRPEWQREEDPALYAALKGGRIPAVEGMNRAFTHVDSIEDVTMAYYAASQIVVFQAEAFGFPPLVDMLSRWGRGERTSQVVQAGLGVSSGELDTRFRAWVSKRMDRYEKQYVPDLHAPPLDDARKAVLADPTSAKKHVELALALLSDEQLAEGEALLTEALRLDPKQADATYVRLKLALSADKSAEAARLIAKMVADGHDGYAVRMRAAELAEAQKDKARLRASLEAAARFDPIQAEPIQGLYDLAHAQKDAAGELSALRKLAMLDQHDRRVWKLLLEQLLRRGAWEEARKVGESAMFIDVMNPDLHRLYARALARRGRFVSAVYELNSALIAKPPPAMAQAIYRELAQAYDKLGEAEHAKQALAYAEELAARTPAAPTPPSPKPPTKPSAELRRAGEPSSALAERYR
jgi:tetratricopeptide (TPR) repeat protein